MTNQLNCLAVATLATVLAVASGSAAADVPQEVKEVYQRFAEFLTGHEAFSVDVTVESVIAVGDEEHRSQTIYDLAFERPNKLAVRLDNPDLQAEFYLNDTEFVQYAPLVNQYVAGPPRIEPSQLIVQSGIGPLTDIMIIVTQLVLPKPFDAPLEHALSGEYKGEVELGGETCDKIWLDFDVVAWDAYIATGDRPLIFRILPTVPGVEKFLKEQTEQDAEVRVQMDFANWNFDPVSVSEALVFAARDTAEQVDSFEIAKAQDPIEGLLGKPAPAFELSALDGSTFTLADKIGEEIVVLDFWATWCGPCRRGMPIIEKVTGEFADQGVHLYAVNLQEDEETIRAFLEEEGLDVDVLLDKTGQVQAAYFAEAIPQTVIIDKQGIVQAVHVGVTPDLEQGLRSELGALVQGKNLVHSH